MTDNLYQEVILEEFAHPQHFGELEDADAVVPGINASCGDSLQIYLKLDPTKQKITQLKWNGDGCAISISAMSVLAGKINQEHMSVEKIQQLKKENLEEMLGLEEIASGRVKCIMLGLHTLQTFFSSLATANSNKK